MAVPPQPNHRASELFGHTINFFWGGLGHCLPGWSLSVIPAFCYSLQVSRAKAVQSAAVSVHRGLATWGFVFNRQ